jgi:hypothetical protein
MQLLPYKNIVFVFSDPAGANACIAQARMEAMQEKKVALFSNRDYTRQVLPNFTLAEEIPDFSALEADCVFTGTSHPDSSNEFEVRAIRKAKAQGIPVISFIDHWVNFCLRFRGLEKGELPDQIWVVDERAKELGATEGLPAEKLVVSGNPHLYFLKHHWKSHYKGKTYLAKLNIPVEGYHVLFAPDPLSLRNGKETVGFTETEALQDLCVALAQKDVHLLVKCHPLQPVEALQPVTATDIKTHLLQQADSLELVHASDMVIGFFSNLLLEAEALDKPVIRYFPGKPEADLLMHKTSLKKVENTMLLQKEIQSCLYG